MTLDELGEGVRIALIVTRNQCVKLGRKLHPTETRWAVRAAFRKKYRRRMKPTDADRRADEIMHVIVNS